MTSSRQTEAELLSATARLLSEQGYDVIGEPSRSLLPEPLQHYRPDAIAIGRDPKLIIEIASERSSDAERVAELQQALRQMPGWQLYLVLNRASSNLEMTLVADSEIGPLLDRALIVAQVDTRAALLMAWAALEALSRQRRPLEFARPQSPGRIIEGLASQGIVAPSDAAFLRSLAESRNAFAHGDLRQTVSADDITKFIELVRELTSSSALQGDQAPV